MIPEGWKLTSLSEVCSGQLQTGPFGSQLHACEYQEVGVPVLMPKDLVDYRANIETAAKISPERAEDLKKHRLLSGDLLFSRRGDVTRFALIDKQAEKALCGTGCLKATPSADHSSKFLAYFLQKQPVRRWLEQNAVGQTMPNMNTAILSELPLMVASSLIEEEKIAKILSIWDKAITTTEKLLASSQQQKKVLLKSLITGAERLKGFSEPWSEIQFSELVNLGKEKFNSKLATQIRNCVELEHISQETAQLVGMTTTYHAASAKSVFQKGSILFGKLRPYLRKYWLANQSGVCSTEIWVFNTNLEKSIPEYIHQLVQMDFFIDSCNISSGTRMPRADWKVVKDLLIPLPPLNEQQKIAKVLAIADQEIETLQKKLTHLKQEKKALMQQLLTGKRRVKLDNATISTIPSDSKPPPSC